ncbi:hypothetical protein [uncultured Pedobacter sp.]|uniref:hypothetical protein n=1 Tax=uncultured Pedobacter sp. TaxID=246139 RepID=UPI0025FE6A81|nr:hypothetical protein [uncultured Pedobacter sp.]
MKPVQLMLTLILLSACTNTPKKAENERDAQTAVKDTHVAPQAKDDAKVKNWSDDFKNFREAVYSKDFKKLKTYFDFPIADEGGAIWSLCNLTDAEIKARKNKFKNPDLFYEQDLEQYYNRIFNADFVKTLLKIKSEQLYETNYNETPETTTTDTKYKLIAEYNKTNKVLSLNLAYTNNAKDEEGNEVSEGEYNIIYSFIVIDGKYLKFKKIDIAG